MRWFWSTVVIKMCQISILVCVQRKQKRTGWNKAGAFLLSLATHENTELAQLQRLSIGTSELKDREQANDMGIYCGVFFALASFEC